MRYEAEAVEACNDALIELGQKVLIEKLTGTGLSANELVCARKFDRCRKAFLRLYSWGFAFSVTPVCVTEAANPLSGEWRFRFQVPGDALAVTRVGQAQAFRRVEDWIWTKELVESVEYVRDVENVEDFDPLARRAFVLFLAREIAVAVTGGMSARKNMENTLSEALATARVACCREEMEEDANDPNPYLREMGC